VTPSTWQDYFQPGERLLWEGAPKPGVHGKAKIIALALFGMPFLIIGIATGITGLQQIFTAQGWNDVGFGLF
jgi:hypothetical protein